MKKTSKLFSLLLAFVLVLGFTSPTFAAAPVQPAAEKKTESVTLHKLLMTKEELASWDSDVVQKAGYNGTQTLEELKQLSNKNFEEIAGVYFAWQVKDGDEWKYLSKNGTVLNPQPQSITEESFANVLGNKTEATGFNFNTSSLEQPAFGKEYRIVEVKELSTYKNDNGNILADSKAVPIYITLPLVNADGVVTNAHVYPKNTEDKPQIDKNFAEIGANYANSALEKTTKSVEIGQVVPYEVKTLLPKGTEYNKVVLNDTMTNGLTFDKNVVITFTPAEAELTKDTDYKLVQDDRGFNITLTQSGLDKLAKVTKPVDENNISTGQGKDVEITLKYSATVNANAVVDVKEKNNITLDYGNKPGKEIQEFPVKPVNGELKVEKSWGIGNNAPEDVTVVYTLTADGQDVASVSLNGKESQGTVINVGKGITFVVEGEKYSGKFVGLTEGPTYKFLERVSGYTAQYPEDGEDGKVSFINSKDNNNPTPLNPTEPEVVTHGKKFVKTDSTNEAKPLAGAQFVVKNNEGKYLTVKTAEETDAQAKAYLDAEKAYKEAIQNYNALREEKQKEQAGQDLKNSFADLKTKRDEAFKKAAQKYEWKELAAEPTKENPQGVLVLSSDDKGNFEITGLAKGEYKLLEIATPNGYAKLPSEVTFTVDNGTYALDPQRVQNKKISIPQTGGIGTLVFSVAGIAMMGAAAFAMKKNNKEDEE